MSKIVRILFAGSVIRRVMLLGGTTLLVVALVIQLVPYGRDHANPPVEMEPSWDRPQTRELSVRACFDCHSNETKWPWYSNVAPISWMVQNHVDEGRKGLNFSEWNRLQEEADEAAESVREKAMPPKSYLWLHPDARLDSSELDLLIQGLEATFGSAGQETDGDESDDDETNEGEKDDD